MGEKGGRRIREIKGERGEERWESGGEHEEKNRIVEERGGGGEWRMKEKNNEKG